ncbi:putative 60Kd inner membrane protein [Lyophyllum shimeji]|uniref:60Kd inner membrane protein n=1 Tax=Lyophyllum shimeji TaxID=47721 RepID=A0A9P3Q0K3_LYOSH|nr:putative 60Kd inner membrane protein [Lyophyllum shimeji]
MAFAGALSSSARLGPFRLAGQRLTPRVTCVGAGANARSFSLLVLRSARSSNRWSERLALTTRNITQQASETPTVLSTPAEGNAVTTASNASAPPEAVPADASTDVLSGVADAVTTHLPAALQYGDLAAMGLVGWTPAGLVRWSLELINVTTSMPWFWTIVAGSLLWKALLFPITVKSLRNSSRLLPLQPHILKMQKEMEVARKSGDKLAMQRAALKIRKLYSDAGVSMGATALVPFVQIPVTLGMFFGVKKMCELPVPQLKDSGVSILPDLTTPDPYMALPVLLCAAVNMQISVGAAELNLTERPEMGHIMNGLRLLSIAGIWVMSAFPSGLMVSLLTTSAATTVQSWLLQQPRVRTALDIPTVPREAQGRLPSPMETVEYVISKYRAKLEEAKAQAAANARKAGKR